MDDATVVVVVDDQKETEMNDQDYGMLKMHCLNGAQRQADGSAAYAENLRYDYLEGKSVISSPESLGIRYIQGPHPQYGSPDFKAAA
ncbi:MAG: hypothetical protein IPM64_17810 [Phycisphaerales bacterium]|nr:hypothetical protein [Phycisphaerales bacterium]